MTDVSMQQERVRIGCLLALTFVTGMVDAVGFIALDHVFAGTATGNVLVLGLALGNTGFPVLGPFAALVTFCLGAFLAGVALRRHDGRDWTRTVTAVLTCNGLILSAIATVLAITDGVHSTPAQITVSSLAALAMGAQGGVARKLSVAGVNTLVCTLSLVNFASNLAVRGGSKPAGRLGIVVVPALFLGAVTGGAVLRVHIGAAVGLAALVALAVAVYGHFQLHVGRFRQPQQLDGAAGPAV